MRVTSSQRSAVLFLATALLCRSQSTTDRGIRAFEEGRYSVAIDLLKGSTDQRARVFYGLSLAGSSRCSEALPVLTANAVTDDRLKLLSGLAAAKCYISLNQDEHASQQLESLRKRFPENPDVLYLAAKLHMKAFNDASVALFQNAPNSYRVHQLGAEIFEIDGRYKEAVEEYRKAIELNPSAPDLHFRLGRALLLRSHDPKALDEASEEFRAELKLSPEDSACHFQLAQIALAQGDRAAARTSLDQALKLTPNFVGALVALAQLDLKDKKTSDAIGLLKRATNAQPENESAHYALMTAYRNEGNLEAARSEKLILDRLNRPPDGEFSNFLKKLNEKPAPQP